MSVTRCSCGVLIEWLTTGGGKRAPFHYKLVPVENAPVEAWTVVMQVIRGVRRAVVVPLDGVRGSKRAAIRHVLVRHVCPHRVRSSPTGGEGS